MKTYYVYTLKCADDSFYTSITCHLAKRLEQHHHGKRKRTKDSRPLELIRCLTFNSLSDAIRLELSLKRELTLA